MNREISLGITAKATAIILVSLLIIYGTLFPEPRYITIAGHHTDKLYHLLGFITLTGVIIYLSNAPLVPTVIAASSFGFIIEILQPYVGRSFDMADIIANTSGAFIGAALSSTVRQFTVNKESDTGRYRA